MSLLTLTAPAPEIEASIAWRAIWRAALISTFLVVGSVLMHVSASGGNPLSLVNPGAQGPSAAVVAQDFPSVKLPDGLGHDGQQFYAIAREPMHLDKVSRSLDRPRYRLQRPLYPVLAWVVHPTGGGVGLVLALLLVNVAAMLGGAVATGVISDRLAGLPRLAALFPLMPGSWFAMRLSTADLLALALTMASLAFAVTHHERRVGLAGLLAVFAKESSLVTLVGMSARATGLRRLLTAGIVAAVGAWWLALHALVAADRAQVVEFAPPFQALVNVFRRRWIHGEELPASITVLAGLGLGVLLLVTRRPRQSVLWWPVALNLGFLLILGPDVIGLEANGSRAAAPLLLLAVLGLLDRGNVSPARSA